MIISRTPFRISFLGGGTDYPAWYLKHGGSVVVTTIDKYCYITCRYLPPDLSTGPLGRGNLNGRHNLAAAHTGCIVPGRIGLGPSGP